MKIQFALFFLIALLTGNVLAGSEVTIFATSDLHGHAKKLMRLAPLIDRKDAIRIDCGDTFTGTFLSAESSWRIMPELLTALNYDVWVPGNHDFEIAPVFWEPLRNILTAGDVSAPGLNWTVPAYRIIRRGKFRIGVAALTDPAMPQRILPGSVWKFSPWEKALRQAVNELVNQNVDLIVLAAHSGLHTPRNGGFYRFLADFPEIDLVIGAHSHQEIPGIMVGKRAYFIQPSFHGNAAAEITVEFDDRTGKLKHIRSALRRPLPEIPAAWQRRFAFHLDREETAKRQLIGRFSPPPALPEKRNADSPLCRFAAQSIREKLDCDAAFASVSAMPAKFQPPEFLTRGRLFALFPYENELCTITLSRREFAALVSEFLTPSPKSRSVRAVSTRQGTFCRKPKIPLKNVPETVTVGLNSYLISASPFLRDLSRSGREIRHTNLNERAVMEAAFRKAALFPDLQNGCFHVIL